MKLCKYQNSISSFYYDNKDSDVIIISQGSESPFEHLDYVYNILEKFAKKKLNVFSDNCFIKGFSENRFLFLSYTNKKFDLNSRQYINEKKLPDEIKNQFNKFYKIKYKKLIKSSFLTDIEKEELQNHFFGKYKNTTIISHS